LSARGTLMRPYEVALLLGAGLIPFVLLARLAGRVADSADSRRVLVRTSAAQACCCVPLIFTTDVAAMTALVALLGTGAAFSQATWQALIPQVVGEQNIGAATAAQQTTFTLASIVAPAAAGLLSGAFGTGVPLAVNAVTFGVMTVAAMAVRTRRGGGNARAAGERDRGGWARSRTGPWWPRWRPAAHWRPCWIPGRSSCWPPPWPVSPQR
jgi:MFS family permease